MNEATFTSCEACKDDPDGKLPWKIRAKEVVHDEEEKSIKFKNAWLSVYDVPVLYTPYFSHPDGTQTRKSGFLTPSAGYSSDLGAYAENHYYWSIAPDRDLTVGVRAMTQAAPLALTEYRQRWDQTSLVFNTGTTYSARPEEQNGQDIVIKDELRGHIFGEVRTDINDLWRAGLDVEAISDDQYGRQYDITSEDVLENRLYAERFENRNYALAQMQLFQDVRVSDLEGDQPAVLPEFSANFIGDPNSVPLIKGRWDANFSMLNLFRDGNEQDMSRFSTDLGWKRRLVSDYGLVSDINANVSGDVYYVSDRNESDIWTTSEDGNSKETRLLPQLHMVSSYPMVKQLETVQWRVEPLAAVTIAPTAGDNDDIPNEDSQNVQIDASNLFSANRFPGQDKVEDASRVTYGVRTGFTGERNTGGEVFLGQSYRLDKDNNPFLNGSGLNKQASDVVGYIKGNYEDYTLQYRFQLDNENLNPERHELDASADWNRLRLNANYLYAQALDGTEVDETR